MLIWVATLWRMDSDQRELVPMLETYCPKGHRAREIDPKFGSSREAAVFELVRREMLAMRVQPTKTNLLVMEVRVVLTVKKMVLLMKEFGRGAESPTINSQLTLLYLGVIRG